MTAAAVQRTYRARNLPSRKRKNPGNSLKSSHSRGNSDKFYDWAESTQIRKLSELSVFEPTDSISEEIAEVTTNYDEKIADRPLKKALAASIQFSAVSIADMNGFVSEQVLSELIRNSSCTFSKEQLDELDGCAEDEAIDLAIKRSGYKRNLGGEIVDVNDHSDDIDDEYDGQPVAVEKKPGFIGKMAALFGAAGGSNDPQSNQIPRFRVGDHVRVRYRGQEGTVIDINGPLYMVSINDGGYVDSYTANQLDKAW